MPGVARGVQKRFLEVKNGRLNNGHWTRKKEVHGKQEGRIKTL